MYIRRHLADAENNIFQVKNPFPLHKYRSDPVSNRGLEPLEVDHAGRRWSLGWVVGWAAVPSAS